MSAQPDHLFGSAANDADAQETREWVEALAAVIATEGRERGHFLIANTRRLSWPEMIAAAAVFRGMNGENASAMASLLGPDQSIPGKPVMRVNDIEGADVVFALKEMMDEGPAHIVHFIHKIRL